MTAHAAAAAAAAAAPDTPLPEAVAHALVETLYTAHLDKINAEALAIVEAKRRRDAEFARYFAPLAAMCEALVAKTATPTEAAITYRRQGPHGAELRANAFTHFIVDVLCGTDAPNGFIVVTKDNSRKVDERTFDTPEAVIAWLMTQFTKCRVKGFVPAV